MPDDPNARVREILERPIGELVDLGLEGGVPAAQHMLALQMIIRLQLTGEDDRLESLRAEIENYLEAVDDDAEPPAPSFLRVVQ